MSLGGFDELLAPFYLEDTDLGYLAWKRGWKVLYQPASVVHHEHRGTIGKNFSPEYIQSVLQKNFILFTWKNIHSWSCSRGHFFFTFAGSVLPAGPDSFQAAPAHRVCCAPSGNCPGRCVPLARPHTRGHFDDAEAFRRTQPAYFHDRFSKLPAAPERPRVLFVSPYSICPPTHGGGVFMYNTLRATGALVRRACDRHAGLRFGARRQRGTAHASANPSRCWCARTTKTRTWPPSRRTPFMSSSSRRSNG